MTNTTITNFRQNVFDYVNQAIAYNDVINITTKAGNAVIMSEDDYNSMMETLYLLQHPRTAQEITESKREPLSEAAPYDPQEAW